MSLLAFVSATALAASANDACAGAATFTEAANAYIESGEARQALIEADRAIDAAPQCALAHVVLARALGRRMQDIGGVSLTALRLSRRYQEAYRAALEIEPDNVEARTLEIQYLIRAPGIAGGDRERAAARIAELARLSPRAEADMRVSLTRVQGTPEELIDALEVRISFFPDDFRARSEYARRAIGADQNERAEQELVSWPDGDNWREAERSYLRGAWRVRSGADLESAEELLIQSLSVERDPADTRPWPSRSQTFILIGAAREQGGKTSGARDAYLNALSEDPENDRARAGLDRLGSL